MAQTLTAFASKMSANAAAVATAMAGGTTTAEMTALAQFLAVCGQFNDHSVPLIQYMADANRPEVKPT